MRESTVYAPGAEAHLSHTLDNVAKGGTAIDQLIVEAGGHFGGTAAE